MAVQVTKNLIYLIQNKIKLERLPKIYKLSSYLGRKLMANQNMGPDKSPLQHILRFYLASLEIAADAS